ncbi:MAG: dual specificity protein phosphatase family protein [Porticoccaceae bacterium]
MTPKNRTRLYRCLTGALLLWAMIPALATLIGNLPLAVALALLSTVLAFRYWKKHLRHWLIAHKFAAVVPGRLYRSGQISRHHLPRILRRHRIGTVIDLTPAPAHPNPHQRAERDAIAALGIQGLRFPMRGDGSGELLAVADAVTALHRALAGGGAVLVHCAAGVQRTGHVLSAYLLLVAGAEPAAVYQYAERFGWEPSRSRAWPEQLNRRMELLAEILVDRGVIAAVPRPLPAFPLEKPRDLAPWWAGSRALLRMG